MQESLYKLAFCILHAFPIPVHRGLYFQQKTQQLNDLSKSLNWLKEKSHELKGKFDKNLGLGDFVKSLLERALKEIYI